MLLLQLAWVVVVVSIFKLKDFFLLIIGFILVGGMGGMGF